MTFREAVARLSDQGVIDLAAEFDVARSTVTNWMSGSTRPHPMLQKQVISWINRECTAHIPRHVVMFSDYDLERLNRVNTVEELVSIVIDALQEGGTGRDP